MKKQKNDHHGSDEIIIAIQRFMNVLASVEDDKDFVPILLEFREGDFVKSLNYATLYQNAAYEKGDDKANADARKAVAKAFHRSLTQSQFDPEQAKGLITYLEVKIEDLRAENSTIDQHLLDLLVRATVKTSKNKIGQLATNFIAEALLGSEMVQQYYQETKLKRRPSVIEKAVQSREENTGEIKRKFSKIKNAQVEKKQRKKSKHKDKAFIKKLSKVNVGSNLDRQIDSNLGHFIRTRLHDVDQITADDESIEGYYKSDIGDDLTTVLKSTTENTAFDLQQLESGDLSSTQKNTLIDKVAKLFVDTLVKHQGRIEMNDMVKHCELAIRHNHPYSDLLTTALYHTAHHKDLTQSDQSVLNHMLGGVGHEHTVSNDLFIKLDDIKRHDRILPMEEEILDIEEPGVVSDPLSSQVDDLGDLSDSTHPDNSTQNESVSPDQGPSDSMQSAPSDTESPEPSEESISIQSEEPLTAMDNQAQNPINREDELMNKIDDLLNKASSDVEQLFAMVGSKEKHHKIAKILGVRQETKEMRRDLMTATKAGRGDIVQRAQEEQEIIANLQQKLDNVDSSKVDNINKVSDIQIALSHESDKLKRIIKDGKSQHLSGKARRAGRGAYAKTQHVSGWVKKKVEPKISQAKETTSHQWRKLNEALKDDNRLPQKAKEKIKGAVKKVTKPFKR